ncbi:MAG TPA: recombinase family protein [Candidatus Brachybacterium merdavium]|uniref:Recombinase family protein n=1 Tax=Candidatus Brachybacterium merdavium TaxID=2838513 RepID=A0A9D2LE07_9MICO|nr:recombinase family protein [Candidatus Brachybacterium merdavium]
MTFTGKRAAIYSRISKDKDGQAIGVERQESACRELADSLGYQVTHALVDNDISASFATSKRRPGYDELVQLIEAGDVDAVICWDTDRLHRRPLELEHYISACGVDGGTPTHTVNAGDLDLSTSSGRMIARIKGSVAAAESEKMSERIRAQKQHARVNGQALGGPVPLGWIKGDEKGTFEPDPEVAPVLAEATERIARGQSLTSVSKWIADKGVRGRRRNYSSPKPGEQRATWDELGPIMSTSTVRGLLMRPANVGLQEHEGKTYPGRYPAIVDTEDYATAHAALQTRRGKASGSGRRKHLLSGVAYCWCGEAMVGVNPQQYACRVQRRQAGRTQAGHAYRRTAPLDEYVRSVVAEYLDRADVGAQVTDQARKRTTRSARDAAREKLRELEERKRALARLFAAGTIGEAQLVDGTADLDQEIRRAEVTLKAQGGNRTVARIMRSSSPGHTFLDAPVDQQRTLIGELFRVDIEQGDGVGGRRFRTELIHITPKGEQA